MTLRQDEAVLHQDFVMQTYRRWPICIISGQGTRVRDADGKTYIDLIAGIATSSLGHAHPALVDAITEQAGRLIHVGNLYSTQPQVELARRLAELTDGMWSFFCNSGAEAVECALKLARKWGHEAGKHRIITAADSFHGRTFGALSATGQPSKQQAFAPMLEGFDHVPFGDADALEAVVGDDVAAVLLEPIQGETGVNVPPEDYLARVRELCRRRGALLMLDEIQTGMGRTGRWWAHQHQSAAPDVMCLAKGLGGGLPIGACLASEEVAETLTYGDHGSTFGGGPVQCAAALAVLETIESEGLVERAGSAGARISDALQAMFPDAEVRGKGLLIGVDLGAPVARDVVAACLEQGLLVNESTPNLVRLAPPLIIGDDDIDEALGILEKVSHAL